ncbi:MAG: DUF721 domain-containing protein [Rubellimicrobium sp.]|nr:DUF721 domain-containing protein [Rubellimicrobium sp.]
MKQPSPSASPPVRLQRFAQAGSLVAGRIRAVGETRGFAVTRLLTHWPEVVGEGVARIARPVEIRYGRDGLGATLTLLTTGAQAPMLEMQKDQIRDRVNACYGYRAIARIRITQTAPTGFAEATAVFGHASAGGAQSDRARDDQPLPPDPDVLDAAEKAAADVHNTELRLAIRALATNVLKRNHR